MQHQLATGCSLQRFVFEDSPSIPKRMPHKNKVGMEPSFAELPDHILASCFCLTSFASKLHCELVCKSWRSVLQRPAVPFGDTCFGLLPGVWGEDLLLGVSAADEKRARTYVENLHRETAVTAIHIITAPGPLSRHDAACLSWIARRAMTVNIVTVRSESSMPAQLLPHLATALEAARALAPAGWQVELVAGELARTTSSGCLRGGCSSSFVVCVMQSCLMCECSCHSDIHEHMPCRFRYHTGSTGLQKAGRLADRIGD